jgi:hypothetical protein
MGGDMPLFPLQNLMLWTGTTLPLREMLARQTSLGFQETRVFINNDNSNCRLAQSLFMSVMYFEPVKLMLLMACFKMIPNFSLP